uniref:Uncharacterized protein n=1 Tax=Knipowitschia caucasica TaxID=637954 RepID=A0AAV2MIJ4_KNICA
MRCNSWDTSWGQHELEKVELPRSLWRRGYRKGAVNLRHPYLPPEQPWEEAPSTEHSDCIYIQLTAAPRDVCSRTRPQECGAVTAAFKGPVRPHSSSRHPYEITSHQPRARQRPNCALSLRQCEACPR